jgi:hypothetical protein
LHIVDYKKNYIFYVYLKENGCFYLKIVELFFGKNNLKLFNDCIDIYCIDIYLKKSTIYEIVLLISGLKKYSDLQVSSEQKNYK